MYSNQGSNLTVYLRKGGRSYNHNPMSSSELLAFCVLSVLWICLTATTPHDQALERVLSRVLLTTHTNRSNRSNSEFFGNISHTAYTQAYNNSGLWIMGGLLSQINENNITTMMETNKLYYFDYLTQTLNCLGSLESELVDPDLKKYHFYCLHQCAVAVSNNFIVIVNPIIKYSDDITNATHSNVCL